MTHLTVIIAFPNAAPAALNLAFFRDIARGLDPDALRQIARQAERHRFAPAGNAAEADAKQDLMRLSYAIAQVLALAESDDATPPPAA